MTTTETRPATGTPAATPRQGFSAGRIAAIVIGCVLVMLGVNLLAGGGIMRWAEHRQDADGFYTAGPGRFSTSAYAMTVPALDVAATGPDVMYQNALLGSLRIKAEPVDDTDALFVGIGPSDNVAAYLAGVRHDEITEVDVGLFGADYAEHRGGAPAGVPTAQTFWTASASGPGARELNWPVESGDWAVVDHERRRIGGRAGRRHRGSHHSGDPHRRDHVLRRRRPVRAGRRASDRPGRGPVPPAPGRPPDRRAQGPPSPRSGGPSPRWVSPGGRRSRGPRTPGRRRTCRSSTARTRKGS